MNNFYDRYIQLQSQAIRVKSKYETVKVNYNNKLDQKKLFTTEMEKLLNKQCLYEKSISYMKEIIDVLSRSHIEHLETLLNSAIKTIFFDKNYSIELEIRELRNNNSLTIYLIETNEDSVIKTDIKDNGFGVKTIVGFILQVYFILYHKLSSVLFVDEGFSALSDKYIPCLKVLLDSLKDQYGFIFVLIAHDTRFIDIADYKYEINNGSVVSNE